jgi:hypothetical protein
MSAFNQGFVPQEPSAALPDPVSLCMVAKHIREMPWPLWLFGLTPSINRLFFHIRGLSAEGYVPLLSFL